MKKHYFLAILIVLFSMSAKAGIDTVTVSNFQFSPANMPDVIVGDTIRYLFIQGFHNAVATSLPAGAPEINSGDASNINPRTYDYVVTTAGNYSYVCEIHSQMVGTFTANSAAPATLKDFSVTAVKNKPLFSWTTLTEINVNHFSIRVSTDGFKYTEAGRIAASNTSETAKTYTFTDNNVSEKYKYIYYQLAIVDNDGHESFSKVKVFKNPGSISRIITQLGPNPISRPGHLMIQFNSEKEGKMEARVMDINGKVVLRTNMSAFPGLNNAHLHVCDLGAGTYTIQFILDGMKEIKKVVVN